MFFDVIQVFHPRLTETIYRAVCAQCQAKSPAVSIYSGETREAIAAATDAGWLLRYPTYILCETCRWPEFVRDVPSDFAFVSDSQDVEALKAHIPAAQGFDAFFVRTADGEYTDVLGIHGLPALDAPVYVIVERGTHVSA